MATYNPRQAKEKLLAGEPVDYTSLSSLVLQLCCDLENIDTSPSVAGSFCSFGAIEGDGTIGTQGGDWTVVRNAVGDYCVTFADPLDTDCYPILLSVYEELTTADSISIRYYNQTANGFCVHISEGDNGTSANVLRDRKWSFAIPCGDPVGVTIAGPQGLQGIPGVNGINGTDGQNGTNGTNGADGQDGEDGVVECPPMPAFIVPDFLGSNLAINSQTILGQESRDYFVLDANCTPKAVHKRYLRIDATTTNLNTWNWFSIPSVAGYRTPCIMVGGTYRQTGNPNEDDVVAVTEPGAMPDAPYMGQEGTERSSTQRIYLGQFNNKQNEARYYTMVYVEYMQI